MRTNYLFSNDDLYILSKDAPRLQKQVSPRRTNGADDMWTKVNAHVFFKNSVQHYCGEKPEIDEKSVENKIDIMIHINKKYSLLRKGIINGDLNAVIGSVSGFGLQHIINNILTDDELIELVDRWPYSIFENYLYKGNSDAFSLFSLLATKMNAMQFLDLTCSQPLETSARAFLSGLLNYDKIFTSPIYCRNNESGVCNSDFVDYVQQLPFMEKARKNINENREKEINDIINQTLNIPVEESYHLDSILKI